MNKLNHLQAAIVSVSLLFGSVAVGLADSTPLSSDDQSFLNAAVQGGLFEIQTGNYAATNAKNPAVQDLGKAVASDHTSLNQKLIAFANSHGYAVPTDPGVVTKTKIGALTVLSGDTFDQAYLKALKSAHKKDIVAFKNEAASTSNSDLRSLIKSALPTLHHHLKMADTVSEKLANQQ